MAESRTVLITGSTGKQGGAVARELLKRGYKVKAMTRHPDGEQGKALAALGAQVLLGDLDSPSSLELAVKGVWGVFGVQNTWEAGVELEEEQGKRLARIAREAGVEYYLYTSVGSAHRSTGIPHFDNKFRVERTVREAGFPAFTIMRPVFFMENFLSPSFKPGIDQGVLMMGLKPETKLQMIAVEDIGKYGAWAFDNYKKLNGRDFDIAGDSLTMPETARLIGAAAKRDIKFVRQPMEEVRKFSDDWAKMLEWFDAVGYNADIDKMSKESGIKPTRFAEWVKKVTW